MRYTVTVRIASSCFVLAEVLAEVERSFSALI